MSGYAPVRSRQPPYAPWAPPRRFRSGLTNSISSMGSSDAAQSVSDKFAVPFDSPAAMFNGPEADDKLHNPDTRRDFKTDKGGIILTTRGFMNLGCVFVLAVGIVGLFAGFPLASYILTPKLSTQGGFNYGGINGTGQIPLMPGNRAVIDRDTPEDAKTKTDYVNGQTWELVFSDEFNTDGRTFYPGDDPYWEAVDLHYWQTGNLEWYDPSAIMTRNGALEITLSEKPNHNLNFTGGMLSTWNQFCFTGGLVEASVTLPGTNNVRGLWPAIWSMGNLGRAGYGASLDGMGLRLTVVPPTPLPIPSPLARQWPYSYDSCDVGTVKNQTKDGLPLVAAQNGDQGALSFLPGQRLSRCTCPGESHPGPVHENGEYVGRSVPEIDMFEGQVGGAVKDETLGAVSQSAQWAPFNAGYSADHDAYLITDTSKSMANSYGGGIFQQATSVVTRANQDAYDHGGQTFSTYGFQYKPGADGAYIAWVADGSLSWTMESAAVGPDSDSQISQRLVSQEPMYLIMNLGISQGFGEVDFAHLVFPTKMRVDWIRVYQDPSAKNIGCDPSDFPTAAYIAQYQEAYTNALLTTWEDDFKQAMPKNSFLGECS
ncbi:beta-glucan synthesis-associated protein [Epithele typhae]|uniref:beta-glucan synthesis-associated protein n=1 Tax=Epithele typhae TaxID=378194 RepID=UPI0020079277|nr:beta-glucan synthesis-associated protein [Epithele typhae]KAH9913475.1 beta-glucan synthesis-associated protein [Epithele typhae]